ncbi:MAG TPA: FG-GAP repeat protein, partial [Pyrinomonadaceae bacterium]|nr:FG-GAP repeat protein [Pyrinomonadaceae bacterium]
MHANYKRFVVPSVLVFLCCAFVGFTSHRTTEAENLARPSSRSKHIARSVVPDNPAKINFVRGTRADGDPTDPELVRSGIDVSQARPLSLASGDLNADGFPDLVCGYEVAGGGMIVIRYGDERAYAPTDPADVQAVIQNQFRAPFGGSTSITLDHPPEFLFTGDFDRDSRRDVLTAARGGQSMTILRSEEGGFSPAVVDLNEQVTSVAIDEAFSMDGFADVYVGTISGRLLGFEEIESVIEQQPRVYDLPGSVDSIAVGQFDQDAIADFAVIVTGQVYILNGGASGAAERIDVPFSANALAVGDFIWDRSSQTEVAVAGENGSTAILARGALDSRPLTSEELYGRRKYVADVRDGILPKPAVSKARRVSSLSSWKIAEQSSADAPLDSAGAPLLIPMLASGQQSVDLLSVNSAQRKLNISYRTDGLTSNTREVVREMVSFPTDGEPVAVLPMRLNIHSRPSLVVFEQGNVEPSLLFATPEAVFTVTKATDTNDGTCNADCSLREAVVAANAAAGLDSIAFAVALNTVPIQLTIPGDDNLSATGDLDINTDITVIGNGAANTLIQGSTNASFTGNMGDKAFGVNQAGTNSTLNASLQNLTVRFTRNDIVKNGAFTQTGGAMDIFLTGTGLVPGPTTTLTNVTFDSNASLHSYGGGLNIDSGDLAAATNIFRGTISITGSTFSNNDTLTTTVAGTDDPPTGGGINLFADRHDVTVSNSSI